jgi:flavodoxin
MCPSIDIIHASGGEAERVADRLTDALVKASRSWFIVIGREAAGSARVEDLLAADMLVLVSSKAPRAGRLDDDMEELLFLRADEIDLDGRWVACVGSDDDPGKDAVLSTVFRAFVDAHNGRMFGPLLLTGGDPAARDEEIERWADRLLTHVRRQLKPSRVLDASAFSVPCTPSFP